jgi:mannose/fructose/N-acetylgalactosamine-specific phosphotransferase system component IIC
VHDVSLFNAKTRIQTFWPRCATTIKLFILSVNGVLYYFPKCALFQGDQWKIGENLDISKLEILAWVHDFLSCAFEIFYIAIWLCMLLEDVLEILSLLMPKTLLDQFVWGCEQCITTMWQLKRLVYYYLKDLDWIHLACRGLPYRHMD